MIKDSRYYIEYCECKDCYDNEEACMMDCETDTECRGCRHARENKEEAEFEYFKGQGLL